MGEPTIAVDDAVALAEPALASLGRLERLPARSIDGPTLARLDARALVVRSVTRVDAALLDAAPRLELVGTATAGVDHLDLPELRARGVSVASAAGCNAQAVAEWVAAALLRVRDRLPTEVARGPVGIVGHGHVGQRTASLLERLGWQVWACDPPRARAGHRDRPYLELETLWRRCSIVSFHVPLTTDGPNPTLGLVDAHRPVPVGPKLVINTSRGAVVRDALFTRSDLAGAILDVWDGEPQFAVARLADPRLLLASPHVAGYSLEGKIRATADMHRALARWRGRSAHWTGAAHLPPVELAPAARLAAILEQIIDLPGDDARFRQLAERPASERARAFEALRRGYTLRREFAACRVALAPDAGDGLTATLSALGLRS